MSRPLPEPRTRWLVTGKTGTGKSSLVKDALRDWSARGVRIVALDALDEYSQGSQGETGLVARGPLRLRVTARELSAQPALMLDRRLSLAVVPDSREPQAWARAALLVMAMARDAGRVLLVLDETSTWTNANLHPRCHAAAAALTALVENGRHQGVALVLISQRAAGVPLAARAGCSSITTFLQDDPDDLAALEKRSRGRLAPAAVAQLQPFQSLEWSDSDTGAQAPSTPAAALRAVPGGDSAPKRKAAS